MTRIPVALLVVASAIAGSVQAGGGARSSAVSDPAPVVHVSLSALATPIDGPTWVTWTTSSDVVVGATGSAGFEAGENFCSYGSARGDQTAAHRWTVRFAPVSAAVDKIALEVAVERRDGSGQVKQYARHVTLTEGAPHVLDFAEAESESPGCRVKSIVLEISATIVESTAFVNDFLSYDLWLTHRDASGREWTRHDVRTGRQGERLEYKFQLPWPMNTLSPESGAYATVTETISGGIRGRIRADSMIDVSLTTDREFAFGTGSSGHGAGQKNFTIKPGEPVSVLLPPPAGRGATSGTDGSRTVVAYGDLFKGHTTALLLTIRHERS